MIQLVTSGSFGIVSLEKKLVTEASDADDRLFMNSVSKESFLD